jgi:hypothetical protein
MPAVHLRVTQHHRQHLVPTDPLHRRQINPGPYQPGDRGLSHDARRSSTGIETGRLYRLAKRAIHPSTMPSHASCCRSVKTNGGLSFCGP